MDGAGPLRFLWDILIPLSKTNIAALATIMFVYAWNSISGRFSSSPTGRITGWSWSSSRTLSPTS